MSHDEMYELAIKAGCSCKWGIYSFTEAELKKFVQSLIAAEREACAKVCETIDTAAFGGERPSPNDCAAAIRARGTHDQHC